MFIQKISVNKNVNKCDVKKSDNIIFNAISLSATKIMFSRGFLYEPILHKYFAKKASVQFVYFYQRLSRRNG